ncbi:MAG: TIGR02302 family protein [Alphaproteobacteria bacterium]|nr:TIGR02302 family protein [Alphaproteobacteria bacterium]
MTRIPGVGRRLILARLALLWEALWPNLWPILGVAGIFAALVLFDVLPLLPGWLHALTLFVNAIALLWALWRGVRNFRLPRTNEVERRLEQDSGIAHRPLTALIDVPSGIDGDSSTTALWQIHLARAVASVQNLHVRPPQPGLARRDPRALRLAVVIAIIVGFAVAGGDAERRLVRAVSPDLQNFSTVRSATLELWVTPPSYTDLPPRLLASADESAIDTANPSATVHVPVGSRLLALVNQGNGTPQLHVGDVTNDLEPAGEDAWRADVPLADAGSRTVAVIQSGKTLGSWTFDIAGDKAPEITFAEPPEGSRRNALRLAYHALDDYGVVAVRAEIFGPSGLGTIGSTPLVVELPPPVGDPRDGETASFHDLTAHPWAGLDVSVQLVATDGPGQEGRSDRLSVKLPERVFNHPVALAIIAQRRALALATNQRLRIARELHGIAARSDQYGNDIRVFLGLITARARLVHNSRDDAVGSVQTLLWDTALRVEDGTLSLAERDLREAQRRLQEAIARNADEEEISQLMDELRDALDRFLEAFAENLREQLQGLDLSNLPLMDSNLDTIDNEALQQMLDRIEELARTGDREAAQQLLSQLQQMLENLQNQPFAGRPQGPSQSQEMMRELQDIVRRQQELYDQTFRRRQQGTENPRLSAADAAEQNALRRQLGELMRLLGERTGRIPQNLGDAERAMRDAESALSQGQTEGALSSQAQALEELRQAGRRMAAQFFLPGPGQGQVPRGGFMQVPGQDGRDPLGRPLNQRDSIGGLTPDGRRQNIEGTLGAERALRIQQELRQRLRDEGRSPIEIEYYLRLLRRF